MLGLIDTLSSAKTLLASSVLEVVPLLNSSILSKPATAGVICLFLPVPKLSTSEDVDLDLLTTCTWLCDGHHTSWLWPSETALGVV